MLRATLLLGLLACLPLACGAPESVAPSGLPCSHCRAQANLAIHLHHHLIGYDSRDLHDPQHPAASVLRCRIPSLRRADL